MATTRPNAGTRKLATEWPEFVANVEARLRRGVRDYGDKSFSAPPTTLINEIKQELLDVCGWGFILWDRLDRAEHALVAVETRLKEKAKVSKCQRR